MLYTNERWGFQLDLGDHWRLRSERGGHPEFDGDSAKLKIAVGPVPMSRRPEDEKAILTGIAGRHGHRLISDGFIRVEGKDHATITCDVPGLGVLKTYGLIFGDREFLITGSGSLAACDAAVNAFQLVRSESDPMELIRRRAEGGDPDAQFTLGLHLHDNGNDSEAFPWILKAAIRGHPIAQMNAGICYGNGDGTNVDFVSAMKWLLLSVKSGYRVPREAMANIRAQLRPDQFAQAARQAEEWQTGGWSRDEARRYLKSTGDLRRPRWPFALLVFLLVVLACIAYWHFH